MGVVAKGRPAFSFASLFPVLLPFPSASVVPLLPPSLPGTYSDVLKMVLTHSICVNRSPSVDVGF